MWHFQITQPDDKGTPLIDHLNQIWKTTGKQPELLADPPYFPTIIGYLWEWFQQLSTTRNTVMGFSAITYTEIEAWARLLGTAPTSWEVSVLTRLDGEFRQYRAEHAPKQGVR